MPKSATSAMPSTIRMFSGLMSRCTRSCWCAWPSARGDLPGQPQRLVERQLRLALQPGPQRLARDIRHHVVEEVAGRARIEQRHDVRMIQPRRDLDLAQEALAADRRGNLRLQDLDRDLPPVLDVVGQVDGGHAAGADLGLDAVAIGRGCRRPGESRAAYCAMAAGSRPAAAGRHLTWSPRDRRRFSHMLPP